MLMSGGVVGIHELHQQCFEHATAVGWSSLHSIGSLIEHGCIVVRVSAVQQEDEAINLHNPRLYLSFDRTQRGHNNGSLAVVGTCPSFGKYHARRLGNEASIQLSSDCTVQFATVQTAPPSQDR